MDAVKFLNEYRRICDECKDCVICPFYKASGILSCNEWVVCNPEKAVKIVEDGGITMDYISRELANEKD